MAEKKKKFHLLRWLFGGGLVTVVVVVAIVLLVLNASLGAIVQKAVTAFGPKLTGTDIQVEKVKLSLLRGDLQVTNLVVGNPEGYKTPSILEIGEHDTGRDMDQTDGGRGLVDLLTAGAACAVNVHLDILRTYLDFYCVIDLGHYLQRSEGCMSSSR